MLFSKKLLAVFTKKKKVEEIKVNQKVCNTYKLFIFETKKSLKKLDIVKLNNRK